MYEAENQKRSCIGIELKQDLVNAISNNMPFISENCFFKLCVGIVLLMKHIQMYLIF